MDRLSCYTLDQRGYTEYIFTRSQDVCSLTALNTVSYKSWLKLLYLESTFILHYFSSILEQKILENVDEVLDYVSILVQDRASIRKAKHTMKLIRLSKCLLLNDLYNSQFLLLF